MADLKYAKLRGRIKEKFSTEKAFSEALGVSLISVSKKLTGKTQFGSEDIKKWCNLLDISLKEVGTYFFA